MDMKRLRDLVITLLGLWLVVSPRILEFAPSHLDAVWNTWVVGAAIIMVIAVSRYLVDARSPWEDLASAAFGLWLMIAPWALGFSTHPSERSNSLIVGFLVTALSLWAMAVDGNLRKRIDDRRHQQHQLR
jgi:drug/metabolite transporter (DMT)-like permease